MTKKLMQARKMINTIQDAKPKIIHYGCPCCIYSTWNKNEDYPGEALQNIKDHLRAFHDTRDLDDKIKERIG